MLLDHIARARRFKKQLVSLAHGKQAYNKYHCNKHESSVLAVPWGSRGGAALFSTESLH